MALTITYILSFDDGSREEFSFDFDEVTMRLKAANSSRLPDWTRLDFHQCPHCPLDVGSHQHCPPAAHLGDIMGRLGRIPPYETVDLQVVTSERETRQTTSATTALSSLMGLVMASSGCPIAAYFRPMARFHLPLASPEETIFRVISSYLLAQYFRTQQGLEFDSTLRGLVRIYEDMQAVNAAFAERLKASGEVKETNAVAQLDLYAQVLPIVIKDSVEELLPLFEAFTAQPM